jgi:uncharacterized membrane protein HdeD (DUF308 family)
VSLDPVSLDPAADRVKIRRILRHELETIRANWGWFLALGIVLVVAGTLAIGLPLLTSLAVTLTLGIMLVAGGVAQLVGAFWTRDWSGFFLVLLLGVIYVVTGGAFIAKPVEAAAALTLLIACALIVSGVFRIVGTLAYQFPQWGWIFLGGVLNLVLGVLIWIQWPQSGLWVIGIFVGIDMIFSGWTWIMLALRLKSHHRTTHLPPSSSSPSSTPPPVAVP